MGVDPPAGHAPRVGRGAQPLINLGDDRPRPAIGRELERGQPHLPVGAGQADQPGAGGVNVAAGDLIRRQRRQAQQPGPHLAVELVKVDRPVTGRGIPGLAARYPRPEPAQAIREAGAGIGGHGGVHDAGSHGAADRMIGRQQVEQFVAQRGAGLDRVGLGRPADERPQPGRPLLAGAPDDVIPVLGYRAQQRIRWLPARRCVELRGPGLPFLRMRRLYTRAEPHFVDDIA